MVVSPAGQQNEQSMIDTLIREDVLEIVIADDGSSDNTREIVDDFSANNPAVDRDLAGGVR
jgi:glycosyltransferase involved in cell wall biosynthesis